ncbi:MAG TPA: thioredoxin family protein [Anaerolineales bacterium]|nr:thioredoxin family protein [Anaerolineales bacterium]
MNVKILGAGCSICQSMYNTVSQIVAREHMEAEVEYVTDIDKILSYGVLSTPALVINEKIVMLGYRGARKIEQALREANQV